MVSKKRDNREQPLMKNKKVIKDLLVLWLALTALSCAAINLHISLNKLGQKEEWPITSGFVLNLSTQYFQTLLIKHWTECTAERPPDVLLGGSAIDERWKRGISVGRSRPPAWGCSWAVQSSRLRWLVDVRSVKQPNTTPWPQPMWFQVNNVRTMGNYQGASPATADVAPCDKRHR